MTETATTETTTHTVSPIREQAHIERQKAMAETTLGFGIAPFSNGDAFKLSCSIAEKIADSTFIPAEYQGSPANVLVALDYAARLGISPIMLMQNMDVVKGRPGLRGAFYIALINRSPLFSRLKFEWRGDDNPGKEPAGDFGCCAYATELSTGEIIRGPWIDWRMVKAEGWDKNSKWTSMREQMFMYRAGAFWSRANAPDVALGMYESEELRDAIDAEFTRVTPQRHVESMEASTDNLMSMLEKRTLDIPVAESLPEINQPAEPVAASVRATRSRRVIE